MVKSIRWRLILWFALVLTGVVSGFGILLYREVRAARLAEIDSQLESSMLALEATMRLIPPHELFGEPPPPPPPRKKNQPPEKKDRPDPKWLDPRWPEPKRPEPAEVHDHEWFMSRLVLPETDRRFDGEPTYFAIWRNNGTLIKGVNLPAVIPPVPSVGNRPMQYFRDEYRERIGSGPNDTIILIGRNSGNIPAELNAFTWRLIGSGTVVLFVGLLGGWFIAGRVFRPIAAITKTASRISITSLSERIDTSQVDSELAELSQVLNEAFDRLHAAFERQAQFTADASHELRTPLTIIRSQAELTLSRPRTAQEYQVSLDACLRAAVRMTELVERLLLLARADSGAMVAEPKEVRLDRLVNDVVTQLQPLANDKQVQIITELEKVTLLADAVSLSQVISNLCNNAIKYNRPEGKILIKLKDRRQAISLSVEDTGSGIPPEDCERIFERFYRVDQARHRSTGGIGLGLAICRSIVEAHRGTITVESIVGKGTKFRVRLPKEQTLDDPSVEE